MILGFKIAHRYSAICILGEDDNGVASRIEKDADAPTLRTVHVRQVTGDGNRRGRVEHDFGFSKGSSTFCLTSSGSAMTLQTAAGTGSPKRAEICRATALALGAPTSHGNRECRARLWDSK
jgi:hypothetical protein